MVRRIQNAGCRIHELKFWILLVTCPLSLVTGLAQQPQTSVAPIFSANAKYVQGVGPGFWPTAGAGLTLNLAAGTAYCGSPPVLVNYAGGTLAMTNAATNYVYLDPAASCAPAKNTTGFAAGVIPLAKVATAGGAITSVMDARGWFAPLPCTMDSTGAVTCAALGSNQSITLAPSGTGFTQIGDKLLTPYHVVADEGPAALEIATNYDLTQNLLKEPTEPGWDVCISCGGGPGGGEFSLFQAPPTDGQPTWNKKWSVDATGTETVAKAVLTPQLNNIRYADKFPGANMGEKVAAAIADLPSTGGTVDASGLEWWQAISSDVFASVAKPGTLLLGSNTYYVSATQNVPSNWNIRGAFNGRLDGGSAPGGTILIWTGATGQPVLKYFNTEFTSTEGVSISCNAVAGTTGILIDSNNSPASHNNRFEDFQIEGCDIGIQAGTSGAMGYQSDGVILRNFKITAFTTAGLRINSQNSFQDSVVERGFFQDPAINSASSAIDFQFAPLLFSIRNVSFGAGAGFTGAAINLRHPGNSGGAPLYLEENTFEIPSTTWTIADAPTGASRSANVVTITTTSAHGLKVGSAVAISGVTDSSFNGGFTVASVPSSTTFTYAQTGSDATSGSGTVLSGFALRVPTGSDDLSGGSVVLLGNSFANGRVQIDGRRSMVSIGNQWTSVNAVLSHPVSTLATVNDNFGDIGYNWVGSNNLIKLNDLSTGTAIPLRIIKAVGELARFEGDGTEPYIDFKNTSTAASNWKVFFPGTGTGLPAAGDLVFYDQANARSLLHLSKVLGAVGVGPAVNGYMSAGDFSVARTANAGGLFFGYGTPVPAYLDYGLTSSGKFSFSGGPVQMSGVSANQISTSINTVPFSSTPTFDASLGNTQKITLTGNVTSSTLSNAVTGQTINFIICQDATGGWTFTWPANVLGGMTIGSDASKCSAQSFIFDGTNTYALSPGVTSM